MSMTIFKIIDPAAGVPESLKKALKSGYGPAGYGSVGYASIPLTENALTAEDVADWVQKTQDETYGLPLGRAVVTSTSDEKDTRIMSAVALGADDKATEEKGYLFVKAYQDGHNLALNVSTGTYSTQGFANVYGTTNEKGQANQKELKMTTLNSGEITSQDARSLFSKLTAAVNEAITTNDLNSLKPTA